MKKLMLLSFLLLNLFACRNDVDENLSVEESQQDPNTSIIDYVPEFAEVTATLFGKVTDESGNPINNAIVKLENDSETTDENGRFVFKDKSMNAKGTFITVKMEGYFQGSHRFFPRAESTNQAVVTLLSKTKIGSFVSSQGGLVSSSEEIILDFPANSIIQSNDEVYSGEVEVFARFIDPTVQNIDRIMPGDLQGVNTDGEEVALASYGMMAIELESESGEPLNLGNNLQATLTFPVPDELIGNAPAEIPLWYFDDSFGIWVQEGTATLQGDTYVGDVAHFSFWNCDYPYPLIELSGQVLDQNGNPIPYASVRVNLTSNGSFQNSSTDQDGVFSGKVPANEELLVEVSFWNNACGGQIQFSETVGPFTDDTNLNSYTFVLQEQVSIEGSFTNCDGTPLTNGVVEVTLGSTTYDYYISDGNLSIALYNCEESVNFSVAVYNLDDLEESDPLDFSVADNVNIGTIAGCGNALSEYLTVEIDGTTTTFPDPSARFYSGADSSYISAYLTDLNYSVEFSLPDVTSAGTYPGEAIGFVFMSIPTSTGQVYLECVNQTPGVNDCGVTEIVISTFGEVGEYVIGTFTGESEFYTPVQNSETFSYSGSFKILREN